MQKDLDAYLETYNRQRPHPGRGMKGRTPYEVFKAGIPKWSPARNKSARKEVKARSVDLTSARPVVRWLPYFYSQRRRFSAPLANAPQLCNRTPASINLMPASVPMEVLYSEHS